MKRLIAAILLPLGLMNSSATGDRLEEPLRLVVVGVTHGHTNRFIERALNREDIELVGIVEPQSELRNEFAELFNLEKGFFHADLESFLETAQVEAAAIFTSTFEHKAVIETCARHKIHAMVEKPLAVNLEHVAAIETAAKQGDIHVLVNYEPAWSAAYQQAYALIREQKAIGDIRKMVSHDGNAGPVVIGSPLRFREWLTNPELNGGGALFDFGCYGAAMMTWMMGGQRPESVMAVTQSFQPGNYPLVEDEATIVLKYPETQGIIQASWNWSYPRKDFEIHGTDGYVIAQALRQGDLITRLGREKEAPVELNPATPPNTDALSYFKAVAQGTTPPSGMASLSTNKVVVEILQAARESARTGKVVHLKP